jgi:hypothetical protein
MADCRTDVCVVDISVDVVSAIRLGMHPSTHKVSGLTQAGQIVAALKKLQGILGADSPPFNSLIQNRLNTPI